MKVDSIWVMNRTEKLNRVLLHEIMRHNPQGQLWIAPQLSLIQGLLKLGIRYTNTIMFDDMFNLVFKLFLGPILYLIFAQ